MTDETPRACGNPRYPKFLARRQNEGPKDRATRKFCLRSCATGKARRALDLLTEALAREGTAAPGGDHFPRDCAVVPLALWRDYWTSSFRDVPVSPRCAIGCGLGMPCVLELIMVFR